MSPPTCAATPISTDRPSTADVRVVNATPDVARMLRDLGLAWMLEGGAFPGLSPANDPMRRPAA